MSDARHHHYIPQCYLRGFTPTGDKDSQLFTLDFRRRKTFETNPRNVAGRRDFNRVEIEGIEPNAIEVDLGQFEGELALALGSLHRTGMFDGDDKVYVLNLISLLSVRSPQHRENWRQFHEQIADRIMDLALSSKEMWESQIRQMKEAGHDVNEDVTYERSKEFHERGEYSIELNREYHISLELKSQDGVLRTLMGRKWAMIVADDNAGEFITSDNPAILTWQNPENVPRLYRDSPGHGRNGTELYFPISKHIALSGTFDGHEGVFNGSRELVAACNTATVSYAYEQLYAVDSSFPVLDRDGDIVSGDYLVENIVQND